MFARRTFTVLLALLCAWETYSFLDEEQQKYGFRLPSAISPTKYYLHITTRIHQGLRHLEGNVTIELTINEPTDEIILQAKGLHHFELKLTDLQNHREFDGLEHVVDDEYDETAFLKIFSPQKPLNLKSGERYRLNIIYRGHLKRNNLGFYVDHYWDDKHESIPIAATQFEPTNARLAFPCFDEPAFKARFVVSITHGSNYTALSNMPVDGEPVHVLETGMTTTTFQETPMMSTYLIAFVVSNYNHISTKFRGVDHRVFFPPNSKENGTRALQNSMNTLGFFEDYFGVKYPLPKLDHIRLQKLKGAGMENWGLITYSNDKFINDTLENTLSETARILIQCHEIAHQWFGNLVTPKWFTYVWLKEGLAVYFGYIAADVMFPKNNIKTYFIENEVNDILDDGFNYPMSFDVVKDDHIKLSYSAISYRFAACIVKMFHHAIGHKTFIKGVTKYLTKFEYSVADENDFFASIQEAVDEDQVELFQNKTAAIMKSWSHNRGVPIIKIRRNYDDGTMVITQSSKTEPHDQTWWIPLNFASRSSPNFESTTADLIMPPEQLVLFDPKSINLTIATTDWLIVNKEQTGLYYVLYDAQNLELIAAALKENHKLIPKFNRALLFRDIYALTSSYSDRIEPLLAMLEYLKEEEDLMTWGHAVNLIHWFFEKLRGTKTQELFKKFGRGLVGNVFERMYQLPEAKLSLSEVSLKRRIFRMSCEVDLELCLNHTVELANERFLKNPLYRPIVAKGDDFLLCQGIKQMAFEEFKNLLSTMLDKNHRSVTFYEYTYSLQCIQSSESLRHYVEDVFNEMSKEDSILKSDRTQGLLLLYLLNYEARPVLYEMIRQINEVVAKSIHVRAIFKGWNRNKELRDRASFQLEYERNVNTWLTNHIDQDK